MVSGLHWRCFGVGIHNTLEAAVYGIPLYLDRNTKIYGSKQLIEAQGAFLLVIMRARFFIDRFLTDEHFHRETGSNAGFYVTNNAGATDKVLSMINF
jgi:3-deoxy-D-manno-octulosonic-acid transferase